MTTYEAISLMISSAMLVVVVLAHKKIDPRTKVKA